MESRISGLRARDAIGARRCGLYLRLRQETFRGIRVANGREVLNVPIGAYMGASAVLAEGAAYVGTFENEVIGVRSR